MKKTSGLLVMLLATSALSACSFPLFGKDESNGISEDETSIEDGSSLIHVSGVSLNASELKLYVGGTYSLNVTISPSNATNKELSWSSSNPDVATISSSGLVNALTQGETTITVTTRDGDKKATCKVTVVGLDEIENAEVVEISMPEDAISEEFSITADDMSSITKEGSVYTLSPSAKTVYSLSGRLEGRIIVNSEFKVELDFNGVSITSSENAPIYVTNSDNLEIKSAASTYNYINDNRPAYTQEEEGQGKGAIASESGNIAFTGKGSLYVSASYYDGIHTKDNFSLKNTQLKISAPHHGVKANDAVSIESGAIDIDCGQDGLVTENTSLSSKGNQKGNVDIIGGSVRINSVGDGISAAYNCNVSGLAALEIKTDKYSSYSGPTISVTDEESAKWYLSVPSSVYSASYRYAAYIDSEWHDFSYKESRSSGRGSYTYIYEATRPESASSFRLYRFTSSQSDSLENYNAVTDGKSFSAYGDMISIRSVSGSTISLGNWSNYQSSSGGQGGWGGGGQQEGNNDKAEQSAKGIKADNEIHIDGGKISITAYDDGLHTNYDGLTFDNDKAQNGDLYITGGDITISASDDGVHSDTGLYISGGKILVKESYEGIEGNTIDISGGDITVFASDDGVNASSGRVTPKITISGGRLDETVSPNSDTDGVDSNGSYLQTGGIVIARGPNSMNAAALDTDGSVTMSGGTLILLGSIEKTPSLSGITTTTGLSGHSVGDHTIVLGQEEISYNNKYAYAKTTVYSSLGQAKIK